jgi:hypothetical protein
MDGPNRIICTARFTRRLLGVLAITAGCLSASTVYNISSGASDKDGPLSGNVAFFLTNCGTSCILNIDITNTEANPTAAGQLISGLSFVLMNAGTVLPSAGTLSSTISNGSGGGVTVLDSSFNATTTTATPSTWKASYVNSSEGIYLNDLTGAKPANMIIGPGPYTNANPSITGHDPSLAGTVQFSISGITGLTSTTDLSAVDFYYGTGPDASGALTCSSGCSGTVSQQITATPEPGTLFLAGGILLAVGVSRQRRSIVR